MRENFRTALKTTTFQLEIVEKWSALGESKAIANGDVKALGELLLKVTDINF